MFAYFPVAIQPVDSKAHRYEALADHTGSDDRLYKEEATSSLLLHSSIPLNEIAGYAAHIPNQNILILRKMLMQWEIITRAGSG